MYGELCDWYLEIVKPRLYADDNAAVSEFALHVLAMRRPQHGRGCADVTIHREIRRAIDVGALG